MGSRSIRGGISGFLALLPAAAAWAFQPLVTDDTGTQGAGGHQIEAAYNRATVKVPDSRTITRDVPLAYARGVTDTLDLYGEVGAQNVSPGAGGVAERGWGNTVIGAKWRFYSNESGGSSIALKPEIQLPVSRNREARGLGRARASYGLSLLATRKTAFGAVHANVVAERVSYADGTLDAAERRTRYRLSAAPVWDVARGWKLALDAGVMTNPDRTAGAPMGYVEMGALYSPDKSLDLAIGVVRNVMDGRADTLQATMGLAWRFR